MAGTYLSVGFGGDSGARDRLSAFKATNRMVAWADRVGPIVLRELKKQAPVSPDDEPGAGRLRDSIKYERATAIGIVELNFHTDVSYAPYVLEGTPGHEIVPVNAMFLRFRDKGGDIVFRKRVWHPGTTANPFPEKALERVLPELTATFTAMFERI